MLLHIIRIQLCGGYSKMGQDKTDQSHHMILHRHLLCLCHLLVICKAKCRHRALLFMDFRRIEIALESAFAV